MNTEKIVKGLLDQLETIVYNEARPYAAGDDASAIADNTVIKFRATLTDTIRTLADKHNV